MGWGVTGIVNALTQKALIRYVPVSEGKTIEELEEEQGITGFGNFAIMGVLGNAVGSITGAGHIEQVTPDVRKSETERLQSDVTDYALEDGSIVSQHVIQHPREVVLYFEETNAGKMVANVGGAILGMAGSRPKTVYDQLIEIWEDKVQVEITTDQNIYKNMVMTSAPITQRAPYKGALQISCTFKQLSRAVSDNFGYKGVTTAWDKAASKLKEGGRQVLKSIVG